MRFSYVLAVLVALGGAALMVWMGIQAIPPRDVTTGKKISAPPTVEKKNDRTKSTTVVEPKPDPMAAEFAEYDKQVREHNLLSNKSGDDFRDRTRIGESTKALLKATEQMLQDVPPDHPRGPLLRVNQAIILGNLGRHDEALKIWDDIRARSLARKKGREQAQKK